LILISLLIATCVKRCQIVSWSTYERNSRERWKSK